MFPTVAAISTAHGASAINIVRVTGVDAIGVSDKVFRSERVKGLRDARHGAMILGKILADGVSDKGYAVCFFAPKSYTGETLVELQCHGGYLVAEAVLAALIKAGARPAARGEFTRRAFLNGKLSLADAEAIADMIHAESSAELSAAGRQMNGELTRAVTVMARDVENALSELEAGFDYPDELADEVSDAGKLYMVSVIEKLDALLRSYDAGRVVKHGLSVAILGLPNVGKSSILNRLAGSERAIVTDIPGTTRDVIEEKIELDGVLVRLMDTAGVRVLDESDGNAMIEKIGIARAIETAKTADIVLFVTEYGRPLTEEEAGVLKELDGKQIITVSNKCDKQIITVSNKCGKSANADNGKRSQIYPRNTDKFMPKSLENVSRETFSEFLRAGSVDADVSRETSAISAVMSAGETPDARAASSTAVSALTGEGFDKIKAAISGLLRAGSVDCGGALVTNARHYEALVRARETLDKAISGSGVMPPECVAEDLRECYFALGEITGDTATEAVIDAVFERFCVGK